LRRVDGHGWRPLTYGTPTQRQTMPIIIGRAITGWSANNTKKRTRKRAADMTPPLTYWESRLEKSEERPRKGRVKAVEDLKCLTGEKPFG